MYTCISCPEDRIVREIGLKRHKFFEDTSPPFHPPVGSFIPRVSRTEDAGCGADSFQRNSEKGAPPSPPPFLRRPFSCPASSLTFLLLFQLPSLILPVTVVSVRRLKRARQQKFSPSIESKISVSGIFDASGRVKQRVAGGGRERESCLLSLSRLSSLEIRKMERGRAMPIITFSFYGNNAKVTRRFARRTSSVKK